MYRCCDIYCCQGNKGGVSVRMDIAGINICIVNCHLAAHLPQVAQSIEVSCHDNHILGKHNQMTAIQRTE